MGEIEREVGEGVKMGFDRSLICNGLVACYKSGDLCFRGWLVAVRVHTVQIHGLNGEDAHWWVK